MKSDDLFFQDAKYFVFRKYSKKEVENGDASSRLVLYGWTTSHVVMDLFIKQRDPKKYLISKKDKIWESDLDDYCIDGTNYLDFIEFPSIKSGEKIKLVTTMNELETYELSIQALMVEMSSIVKFADDEDPKRFVEMFLNLKPKYLESLNFIGFRPPEFDAIFPSETSRIDEIEEMITSSYEGAAAYYPTEKDSAGLILFGSQCNDYDDSLLNDIFTLESFIKVMKEEL